ncbi:MAG TPA: glycosyltransferase [Mesorhizobium sp.]|jgi:glycosyltransferase involved in cell wall biosynthesis|nr:glycosyltransferase [Mesorhizobium sp.]
MRPAVILCNDTDYFLRHRTPVAEALAASGRRVVVVSGGRGPLASETQGWEHVFVPIERWSFSPARDLALLIRSLSLLLRLRPAAVHLITLKPAVFGGLAALAARLLTRHPRRTVVTIPGLGRLMSPGSDHAGFRHRASRALVRAAIRLLSRSRDARFTFETRHDRDLWVAQGLISAERAHVIGGAGVDPARFHPPAGSRPDRPLTVLFASRLLKAKGLDAFVSAAAALGHRTGCKFLVAGMAEPDEPDRFPVEKLAALPNLDFIGESRDMPSLLRGVDVVCLPTRYGEGIPRILIEAAATGLPCITTDFEGCREIVRHEANGFLVPPGASAQMADAIRRAVERYLDEPELLARHGEASLAVFRAGPFREADVVAAFLKLLTPEGDRD